MARYEECGAYERTQRADGDGDARRGATHRHRLLVVEDNVDLRIAVSTLLELEGFDVTTAVDGAHAIETLAHIPEPCVILLDLMMPVSNGADFRRRQLASPLLAAIPTIIFSSHDGIAQKAAELGISDFLPKPVDFDTLAGLIERLCSGHCPAVDGNGARERENS